MLFGRVCQNLNWCVHHYNTWLSLEQARRGVSIAWIISLSLSLAHSDELITHPVLGNAQEKQLHLPRTMLDILVIRAFDQVSKDAACTEQKHMDLLITLAV